MRNGRNGGYLGQARRFHTLAEREFVAARPTRDDAGIRQAAEKAWGAVVQASNALLAKRGLKPGVGTGRKLDALVQLVQRDRRLQHLDLSRRYSQALLILHARCFYDGDYNLAVVEREIRDASCYIDIIARL